VSVSSVVQGHLTGRYSLDESRPPVSAASPTIVRQANGAPGFSEQHTGRIQSVLEFQIRLPHHPRGLEQ
jgi:hypothetical protein